MGQAALVEGNDGVGEDVMMEDREEVVESGKVAKSGHTNEVDIDPLPVGDNTRKFSDALTLTYTTSKNLTAYSPTSP